MLLKTGSHPESQKTAKGSAQIEKHLLSNICRRGEQRRLCQSSEGLHPEPRLAEPASVGWHWGPLHPGLPGVQEPFHVAL